MLLKIVTSLLIIVAIKIDFVSCQITTTISEDKLNTVLEAISQSIKVDITTTTNATTTAIIATTNATKEITVDVAYDPKNKPRKVEKIDLDGPFSYKTPLNDIRTLYPSCSGGPYYQDGTLESADEQFSFYMQRGNKKKVLFIFGGGGACWDDLTCIGSPLMGMTTYFQDVTTTEEYHYDMQGIVDKKPSNPFAHYTKILIPYCTGDLHLGSRDKEYSYQMYGETINWTIKHRGFDNFLSVLSFLEDKSQGFKFDFKKVKDLAIAGYSAGGYGALFSLPYLTHAMPSARVDVISDSAIGTLTKTFYKTAMWNPKNKKSTSWGVEKNLPNWIGIDDDYMDSFVKKPNGLIPTTIEKYCNTLPEIKAAMTTFNLDQVQIFFYLLMRLKEDPMLTDEEVIAEWYNLVVSALNSLENVSNYESYVSDGLDHGFIFHDRYYNTDTDGVALNEWLSYMLKEKTHQWKTVDAGL